ncbi:hypothetical protein [Comamonas aquatica]|uniref:hypothetical protein n=1 Tax=Comamonas aquatica TaxID=225991 RepID=UPI001B36B412|nr:hypothetical protein [Comamonas aquatica]QTX22052.1 hypothetical protein KAQ61_06310 [Comamonas aquatica]
MNHRKITACLVLSRNMVASPPAELRTDGRALARPAMHLARQHGQTGLTGLTDYA